MNRLLFILSLLFIQYSLAISTSHGDARPSATETTQFAQNADSDDAHATTSSTASGETSEVVWHTDYSEAWRIATAEHKNLFIYFHDIDDTPARRGFETETLSAPSVRGQLQNYVALNLALDATTTIDGQEVRLLAHESFRDMHNRSGVAIVDLANFDEPYYGRVVSEFPFAAGTYYSPVKMEIVLSLPKGSLTQRTMVYAVRIHPESPQSTFGEFDPNLAAEAESHSIHQASITSQGHHNWGSRFQRISARLPNGLHAQEVVAESWPGETLVDACIDCVDSWRHSPGHWSAVRTRHPLFGFDIQRGRNGIWYATGIFGRR